MQDLDFFFILLTIFAFVIFAYQANKNKYSKNKSIFYKISKVVANILNFLVFWDTGDVNDIIKTQIEDKDLES